MSLRKRPVVAAGALVWREREGRLEVLVIHRPRYDDWSWPKGKLDPKEPVPACAVREVAEETGLEVALGVPLPMLRYRVAGGREKEVHYWAARELPAGSPARKARPETPLCVDEVDESRWVTPEKAAKMLSKKSDRKPLKALVALFEEGLLETRAVAFVRHARARGRTGWKGSEAERPLTQVGQTQAERLVPVLAAFGVEAVTSSPWTRCAETVAPFASASGIEPSLAEALTEVAHEAAPGDARRLAAKLLGKLGQGENRSGGAALCTHRPVLPTLLAQIDPIAPEWVRRSRPRKDPYLRPASLAVAHVHDGPEGPRVVGFEVQGATRERRR